MNKTKLTLLSAFFLLLLMLLPGCGLMTPSQKSSKSASSLDAPISASGTQAEGTTDGATSENKYDFEIIENAPAAPAGSRITRLTDDKKAHGSPSIFGNYIAWSEADNGSNPEDMNVVLLDLATRQKYRLGFEKKVFGETVGVVTDDFETVDADHQQSPLISRGYVTWAERPNAGDKEYPFGYKYYYSPLTAKKFEKKALKDSSPFIQLDDENNVFYYPPTEKPAPAMAMDLKSGKTKPLQFDTEKYTMTAFIGVNKRKFYFAGLNEPTPFNTDAKGTKSTEGIDLTKYLMKDSKLYSLDIDYGTVREIMNLGPLTLNYKGKPVLLVRGFGVTDKMFVWAQFNPLKDSIAINSYDFKSKKTTAIEKRIPVSPDTSSNIGTYVGNLQVSDDYVTWVVDGSLQSDGNGIFAYNLKTGKTRNILEGTGIKYDSATGSYTGQKQLDGNKQVFIGYEGERDEATQYSNVYLATLGE